MLPKWNDVAVLSQYISNVVLRRYGCRLEPPILFKVHDCADFPVLKVDSGSVGNIERACSRSKPWDPKINGLWWALACQDPNKCVVNVDNAVVLCCCAT